jgi:hypothetical protein
MLANGQATAIGRFYLATVAPRALRSHAYNLALCLIDPRRASFACTGHKLLLVGGASSGAVEGYVDGVGTSAGINGARGLALVYILLPCFRLFAICSR